MTTIDVETLQRDTKSVIDAAQIEDVLITSDGKVVAVVSKPPPFDYGEYLEERSRLLSQITIDPTWDSTKAISEDRDRG
jgi:antitoxin (DNA-binding transcriptional repressor) of toxin-antitoxin stability system